MLGTRRRPGQDWVAFLRTTKEAGHVQRLEHRQKSLWERACAAVWGWHGHVARREPGHAGAAWEAWRNQTWWLFQQAIGLATPQAAGWRHPRRGRWKRDAGTIVAEFAGDEWSSTAADRGAWSTSLDDFISHCHLRWGGPLRWRFEVRHRRRRLR